MDSTPTRLRYATAAAVLILSSLCLAGAAYADPITLAWDANASSENVIGYKVYVGTQSGIYTQTFDVGNTTSYVFPDAIAGQKYYFTVSAYSAGPSEGPKSIEASGWSNAPPALVNPGNQGSVVGTAISPLQLQGSDPYGEPVSYSATNLPPGLTLQSSTGLITGTGTTAGTYSVTATVRDGALPPLTDAKTFTWTMTAASSSSVTLSPDPAGVGATLTATVSNGPANATDWLGLFPDTADDHSFVAWCYLNGSKTAPATGVSSASVTCLSPAAPGRYQVRLFANNGITRLATSNTITVATLPALTINDVSTTEGQTGTKTFVFTVSLSPASTLAVTVQYATSNGTATAGSDYTAASGTLTFAAGVTSQTISIPVIGDTVFEPNETFAVTLSQATNATIADTEGLGTIVNDDASPGAAVALTPDPVTAGSTLTATVSSAPGNPTDWVGLYAETAPDNTYVDWCYLNGTKTAPATGITNATLTCFTAPASGRYQVRLFLNNTVTKVATSNTITVSGPSVAVTPTSAAVGTPLSAAVSGGPGNPTDWVALYLDTAPDTTYVDWCYLNGTKTAPATGITNATLNCFTVPASGRYQVRLFLNNTVTKVATSNTITVSGPTGPSVALSPDPAAIGTRLNAAVSGGPGNATDWVGLYLDTAPDNALVDWCYLNGTKAAPATGVTGATVTCFTVPASGRYQVRLFSNNTVTKVTTSNTITVP